MFWALLGLAVPVIIHLWHKKKGELLPWAATRWLDEKLFQQARGIRLEDLFLLVLRLALLAFLVLALTQPFLKSKQEKTTKAHLFYPHPFVLDNYKFELEEALRKQELVFWLNGEELKAVAEIPMMTSFQYGINRIAQQLKGHESAEIYLDNRVDLQGQSLVFVPFDFNLNIALDSLQTNPGTDENSSLAFGSDKKIRFTDGSVKTERMRVLVEVEEKPVLAALKAIEQVYGLSFDTGADKDAYDLVLTNEIDEEREGIQLVFGNQEGFTIDKNIRFLGQSVGGLGFEGSLPEVILENLLAYYGEEQNRPILSESQIRDSFESRKDRKDETESKAASVLMILFLVVLVVERWVALR